MENQTDIAKTVAELARLDQRGKITKAETLRIPETQRSARKQDTSFPIERRKLKQGAVQPLLTTKIKGTLTQCKIWAV